MGDYRERFCRYGLNGGHYRLDSGFLPVRDSNGKINGYICPECQDRRKADAKKAGKK